MKNLFQLLVLSTAAFLVGWSVSSITQDERPVIVQVLPKPEPAIVPTKQKDTAALPVSKFTAPVTAKPVAIVKSKTKHKEIKPAIIPKDWASEISTGVTPFTVDSTVIVLYRSEDTFRIYTGDIPYSTIGDTLYYIKGITYVNQRKMAGMDLESFDDMYSVQMVIQNRIKEYCKYRRQSPDITFNNK